MLSNKRARNGIQAGRGAQTSWRRLDGHNQFQNSFCGVTSDDGIEVIAKPTLSKPKNAAGLTSPGRHQIWR